MDSEATSDEEDDLVRSSESCPCPPATENEVLGESPEVVPSASLDSDHEEPGIPPPMPQGADAQSSGVEEDCPVRRSQRCPRPPDRLAYYQSQVLKPLSENDVSCFLLVVLIVLILVKIVLLLFSPVELMVSVMVICIIILFPCPGPKEFVRSVMSVCDACYSHWVNR